MPRKLVSLVFLDAEFTQFIDVELLSLGLVTLADETRELYVELDMTTDLGKARRASSSDFVRYEGVLDQWGAVPGATATDWEMGRRAGDWLLALSAESGTRVEVAFDYPMDFELLEYAVRDSGLWDQVREVVWPVDVAALTGGVHGELASEECYRALKKRGLNRHHALADAHALRAAYRATKDVTLRLARFGATPDFQRLLAAAESGAGRVRTQLPAAWSASTWLRGWLIDDDPTLRGHKPLDVFEGPGGADHLDDLVRALKRGEYLR
jgi:hypothetical protein